VKAVHTDRPTLFIYDSYPGGIGLSEKIQSRWDALLREAANHVSSCRCKEGCPVCIGAQEAGIGMKKDVNVLLQVLAGGEPHVV
jgi:DEAD/DEAH box helicase domain-containing protein